MTDKTIKLDYSPHKLIVGRDGDQVVLTFVDGDVPEAKARFSLSVSDVDELLPILAEVATEIEEG